MSASLSDSDSLPRFLNEIQSLTVIKKRNSLPQLLISALSSSTKLMKQHAGQKTKEFPCSDTRYFINRITVAFHERTIHLTLDAKHILVDTIRDILKRENTELEFINQTNLIKLVPNARRKVEKELREV